jgi:hypothetical protein
MIGSKSPIPDPGLVTAPALEIATTVTSLALATSGARAFLTISTKVWQLWASMIRVAGARTMIGAVVTTGLHGTMTTRTMATAAMNIIAAIRARRGQGIPEM